MEEDDISLPSSRSDGSVVSEHCDSGATDEDDQKALLASPRGKDFTFWKSLAQWNRSFTNRSQNIEEHSLVTSCPQVSYDLKDDEHASSESAELDSDDQSSQGESSQSTISCHPERLSHSSEEGDKRSAKGRIPKFLGLNVTWHATNEKSEEASLLQSSESIMHFSDHVATVQNEHSTQEVALNGNGQEGDGRRIEGLGNSLPTEVVGPRTLRDHLRIFKRRTGMEPMEIGSGNGSFRFGSSLRNVLVDIAESILPEDRYDRPDSDSDDCIAPSSTKSTTPSSPCNLGNQRASSLMEKRKELGNDSVYATFLECELRNRELEIEYWKRKVRDLELELEAGRLQDQVFVPRDATYLPIGSSQSDDEAEVASKSDLGESLSESSFES